MSRIHKFDRKTKETHVTGQINLDGQGLGKIDTGIGFLDHMLDLFKFHSRFDLDLTCKGDLEVCPHHSVEDVALALGEAIHQALGDRKGIARYASFYLPMDECLTRTVLDLSGRPWHVFLGQLDGPAVGAYPTEMTKHFFTSLANAGRMTLHQEILYGENDHHRIESLFKGLARAMALAVAVTGDQVPSSKGLL